MTSRRAAWIAFAIIVSFAVSGPISAQPNERKFAAKYMQDLRKRDSAPKNLRPMGQGVTWEETGARVRLPGGEGPQRPSGLSPDLRIEGDFDVILAYEIINAEQPVEGFGNGVSLYLAIDTKTENAASLARRVTASGANVFVCARQHTAAKLKSVTASRPSQFNTGKLRIERIAKRVRFWYVDGDDPEFKLLNETEFGDEAITFMQIGGNPGGGEAALDLRLLEVSIRADRLIGNDIAPFGVAVAERPDEPSANSPLWLFAGAGVFAVTVILAIVGVGAAMFMRQRMRSARLNAASTTKSAAKHASARTAISFVCTECNKPIKVTPELAGRKVKCPHCGRAVPAPGKVAGVV